MHWQQHSSTFHLTTDKLLVASFGSFFLGAGIGFSIKGRGGFGTKEHSSEKDIIYTVVTRLEISSIKTEVHKIDPHAFMVMNSIKDVKDGLIKK